MRSKFAPYGGVNLNLEVPSAPGRELDRQDGRDRREADDVLAEDRAGEAALDRRRIGAGAEAHRAGHRPRGGESDRAAGRGRATSTPPTRGVPVGDLDDDRAIVASMTAAISRFIGRAAVVTRA